MSVSPVVTLKNDLLLRALAGEAVQRPPVWMMRQAGRYLPDYRKLQDQYDFFTRVQTPDLVAEITVMPVHQVGVDAAILFSDILVMLQAFGVEVQMVPGKGPVIPHTVRTLEDARRFTLPDVEDVLHYVMDGIRATQRALDGAVPLIGFAGAPWTLLCYWVEGKGSKAFDDARAFCFAQPEAAHYLLDLLTEATIRYLNAQVAAGVQAVQLFDSWAGLLAPADFYRFSFPYLKRIAEGVSGVPLILFARGAEHALADLAQTPASALGLDWTASPEQARALTGGKITLQGNFDPAKLLAPVPYIQQEVRRMMDAFGCQRYIANLGHGILPQVPPDHARAFVEAVQSVG
ncbi:MAG: uroporphyrinogen decarboxylase [Bacteroidetes bacterium]|nr:uroporphyrinogen decarboxylase [Bacteroidota bacterium]